MPRKTRKNNRKHRKLLKIIQGLFIVFVSFGFIGAGAAALWIASFDLPDLNQFDSRIVASSTKIYDRTGETLLYDVHENVRRTLIDPELIHPFAKNAIVAIEDDEFYLHSGIDLRAIMRAALINVKNTTGIGSGGGLQGGSTITQQVVKNALLTQDRVLSRKVKEIFLSLKLENLKTKDEILGISLR